MKTQHICKASQLQVGDTLISNGQWDVIQIEEERFGLEVRLRNYLGQGRVKFLLPDEIVTVEL